MRNTKLVNDYKKFVNKSAGKLRAFRAAAWPILILTALSCTKDSIPTVCLDGNCDASIIFPVEADENGYYHVPLDWDRDYYPYFTVDVEADLPNPFYFVNGEPVVSARFNSNTSWILSNDIINIAQNTKIYFKSKGGKLSSKRTLGPFPPTMIGDTITVFMEVEWNTGVTALVKPNFIEKFIVK